MPARPRSSTVQSIAWMPSRKAWGLAWRRCQAPRWWVLGTRGGCAGDLGEDAVATGEEFAHDAAAGGGGEEGLALSAGGPVDSGAELLVVAEVGVGAGDGEPAGGRHALRRVALPIDGAAGGEAILVDDGEAARGGLEEALEAEEYDRRQHPRWDVALGLGEVGDGQELQRDAEAGGGEEVADAGPGEAG